VSTHSTKDLYKQRLDDKCSLVCGILLY